MTLNIKKLKGSFWKFGFEQKRNLNSLLFGVESKFYIIVDIKF